jgi:dTDP-4-amino-4,6-dideoxygalactose transaminase
VLVDAGDSDLNIDVAAAEAAIGPRTRFVMPVHLYGQLADARALRELAQRRGLRIVEDACQAHGAERDGIRAGTLGVAAFSFYPGKNLGAMGDAGALSTDDADVVARVRALREHGQTAKYHHAWEGWTARLDTIQAIVLLHKLPLLDGWNEERREAARYYLEALAGLGDLKLPPVAHGSNPVWHLFVVRTADPSALGAFLHERGIGTGRHYPVPVHLSPAYASLGHRDGTFPVAESAARELLSLPIFPGITEQQLESVVAGVAEYFRRGG